MHNKSQCFFVTPAFREVFDLFDSNGGGSIDAEELDEALRSVDIELTREEIKDVLKTIDNDGELTLHLSPSHRNIFDVVKSGLNIRFTFIGASWAPSIRHLGALIRTCGPSVEMSLSFSISMF